MASKRDSALEVEQEVLADRLDAFQPPAVEPARDVQRSGARMGSLDLDPLSDESLQAASSAVDAVALGHVSRPRPNQSSPDRPRPRPRPRPWPESSSSRSVVVVSCVVVSPVVVCSAVVSESSVNVKVDTGAVLGRAISPVGTREVTAGGTSELPDAT